MTHEDVDRVCDALLITEIGFWPILQQMAAKWLGNEVAEDRQKINSTINYILKRLEADETNAHFYQRGFTSGLEAARSIYGRRSDA